MLKLVLPALPELRPCLPERAKRQIDDADELDYEGDASGHVGHGHVV